MARPTVWLRSIVDASNTSTDFCQPRASVSRCCLSKEGRYMQDCSVTEERPTDFLSIFSIIITTVKNRSLDGSVSIILYAAHFHPLQGRL